MVFAWDRLTDCLGVWPRVPQLGLEISRLAASGLKSRQHTLQLSRLMVRAESDTDRCTLLQLLRAADQPCRSVIEATRTAVPCCEPPTSRAGQQSRLSSFQRDESDWIIIK